MAGIARPVGTGQVKYTPDHAHNAATRQDCARRLGGEAFLSMLHARRYRFTNATPRHAITIPVTISTVGTTPKSANSITTAMTGVR